MPPSGIGPTTSSWALYRAQTMVSKQSDGQIRIDIDHQFVWLESSNDVQKLQPPQVVGVTCL